MFEGQRTNDEGRASISERLDAGVDCLRVSVTDRCDLACVYCMPSAGGRSPRPCDHPSPIPRHSSPREILRFEEIVEVAGLIRDRLGVQTVRLTGGEPLVRRDVARLVELLAQRGIKDLAMTTNAQRLAGLARPLRDAGLRRVNVSLDSLDPARYARLTRGGRLGQTLAGIEAARSAGFDSIKLNTVVLRGENDGEVCDLVRFAMARGFEIRFLELMAIGVAAPTHARCFVSSDEVRGRLSREFRLSAISPVAGERIRTFFARDGDGRTTRVGFISPETDPFCAGCRRLRLTADGRLLSCLMHATGPTLRPLLRRPGGPDLDAIEEAVRRTLCAKPRLRETTSPRLMAGIGG